MWIALAAALSCTPVQRPPNISELPPELRLPTTEQFTFGPGDSLRIRVWRHDDLTMDVTIAPDGAITYPLAGRVVLADKTYEQVVRELQAKVAEYYVDAQVQVNVLSVTNQKVFVLGEVQQPQVLQVTTELSLLEALIRTGGINPSARTSNVLLVRGGLREPTLYTVDVDAIYSRGDVSQVVFLQEDIVVVPATTITNVERFFRHVQAILSPAVGGSAIYRNALGTGAQGTSSAIGD